MGYFASILLSRLKKQRRLEKKTEYGMEANVDIDSNRFLEERLHKKEEELKEMQEILLELRNKYEELKREYHKLGDIICGNNRKDN